MPLCPSPIATQPLRWGSLYELSHLLKRPYKTIYMWLMDGTLAEFGIVTYQDHLRRWWVKLPEELN